MLHTLLSQRAQDAPDTIAVIQGQRRVTYGELEQHASRVASFLVRNGTRKGDRIGILSRNSPEYIAAYLGAHRAGGIAVDINFQDSAREIKTIINHCAITTLIAENSFTDAVAGAVKDAPSMKTLISIERRARACGVARQKLPAPVEYAVLGDIIGDAQETYTAPELGAHDIASIIYTSGTTGKPKGVMLSHENIMANARSIVEYLRLREDDKVMVVLPFCYSYGKSLFTTHLLAGGTVVLENSFMYPNVVFDTMVKEEVTGFAGVPSTFAIMLNRSNFRNYRFPKLRYMTQAGGAMPPQHARQLTQLLPETKIYIMYGQTEATARLTYLEPDELQKRSGSIGKPIPGVEIEVVQSTGTPAAAGQEGEIVARGKNIMAGYWNDPEETKKVLKEGRLYTGDLGRMDEDGFLYIVGRRSDIIKSGAHRISPKEIEEVIHEMDEVHEVSVVGAPDNILGESIRAVVVLKEGRALDVHQVQRHCQTKLALFKIPKEVLFVEALPKTSSGKVMRFLLKNKLALYRAAKISPEVSL
jgi:acyl-CoA synthetase (AMP-forming)/AMP-acid ligase II